MNGYGFTERVRQVLAMARDESHRLHHEYVGTEHILLGLIREGEGVGVAALESLKIDLDAVRQRVEEQVKRGDAAQVTGPDLPYTSRAKKVLELSMAEARDLHHSYVGTEHLLLGLLREERGIAAQVLTDAGATTDRVRAEILRILGSESGRGSTDHPKPSSSVSSDALVAVPRMSMQHPMPSSDISSVTVEVRLLDGSVTREAFNSTLDAIAFLARQ